MLQGSFSVFCKEKYASPICRYPFLVVSIHLNCVDKLVGEEFPNVSTFIEDQRACRKVRLGKQPARIVENPQTLCCADPQVVIKVKGDTSYIYSRQIVCHINRPQYRSTVDLCIANQAKKGTSEIDFIIGRNHQLGVSTGLIDRYQTRKINTFPIAVDGSFF